MKLKHAATLSTALILLFAAGCQSQSASEGSAKKESNQVQTQETSQKKDEPKEQEQASSSAADQSKDQKQTQSSNESASSEKNDTASGKAGDSASKDNQSASEQTKKDDSASKNTESTKNSDTPYMSPFELREELQIGMSKQDVDQLLQNSEPVEVKSGSNAAEFRYDYMPQPGYKPSENEIDTAGLKTDKVDAQIIVKWDKAQKLEMFTIYHKNDDGKILKYQADANQQEETTLD